MEDFPGNSNAARKPEPDRIQKIEAQKSDVPDNVTELNPAAISDPKKVRKITEGKVKKKPLSQQFKQMFVHDGGDFVEHLAEDVIVPMMKNMALSLVVQIGDGIKRGFEDMIFGPDQDGRRRPISSNRFDSRPQVNYQRMSSPTTVRPGSSNHPSARRDMDRRSNRVRHITLHTRAEGDDVIEELQNMIDRMGHCTVGDYYGALGVDDITSTDHEWGWTTLLAARVRSDGDGDYYIDLPRPRAIDF